ncbi:MAG: AcrR family transcriptional regulator [Verrucomicrobiales bacterium]
MRWRQGKDYESLANFTFPSYLQPPFTHMMDEAPDHTKSPYHHGDLRNALVEASLKVLKVEGLGALSLRRAAREAKVSPAAPYRHFKDKESLLCSLSAYGFAQLTGELDAAHSTAPGDLEAAGQAYMAFALREPQCFRLMFTLNLPSNDPAQQELKLAGDNAYASLLSNIRTGIRLGSIVDTDADELALAA